MILPFENANVRLKRVLFLPSLRYNIVSIGSLADKGIESHFGRAEVKLILKENGFFIGSGNRDSISTMYMLPHPIFQQASEMAMSLSECKTAQLCHRRLAHINPRDPLKLHKHFLDVTKLKEIMVVCRAYRLGKELRSPFPDHFEDTEKVGSISHSDIVGMVDPSLPDRFRYVPTFLDGNSRYTFAGIMCHRSDMYAVLNSVSKKFCEIGGAEIHKHHTDGSQEYINLQNSLGGHDEDKSFSPPSTPE